MEDAGRRPKVSNIAVLRAQADAPTRVVGDDAIHHPWQGEFTIGIGVDHHDNHFVCRLAWHVGTHMQPAVPQDVILHGAQLVAIARAGERPAPSSGAILALASPPTRRTKSSQRACEMTLVSVNSTAKPGAGWLTTRLTVAPRLSMRASSISARICTDSPTTNTRSI